MILEKDFSDPTALRTRQLFSSLPRSDQRRWAEVFIRGLLSVPGRLHLVSRSAHQRSPGDAASAPTRRRDSGGS